MAYSMVPSAEQITLVSEFTDFREEQIIAKALQMKNLDVEAVTNEYFESPENFIAKYGHTWDENAFSSNREGDAPVSTAPNNPAFVIHPADNNQVLYGSDPDRFLAPSRPPSRANNGSPMSRLVDATAGPYVSNARQQEEEDIQKAINESLSGVQSPQPPPGPPPLPPPLQESGITANGQQFGPANRPDYDPNEWAMVQLKRYESDPEPAQRTRIEGIPVFLRCRMEDNWKQHRIGGVLTVLHSIPAARNTLLRLGGEPPYGYGTDPEWWKGAAILPPDAQQIRDATVADGYPSDSVVPPWCDELHRLVAFLDSTDRSYGTADILAASRAPSIIDSGDGEMDFFECFSKAQEDSHGANSDRVLTTRAIVRGAENDPGTPQPFTILDARFTRETLSGLESFYDVWDHLFLLDTDADEDPRTAVIADAAEVLVFRFTESEGFEQPIDIPETFYLDRYLAKNVDKIKQIRRDLKKISAGIKKSFEMERLLTQWVNPKKDGSPLDRRTITKTALAQCRTWIRRIKNRASWEDHKLSLPDKEVFYLPEREGQPTLNKRDWEVIQYYEGKIRQMKKTLAEIESALNDTILPERDALRRLNLEVMKLFKGPAPEQNWYPTHKYILRGVICDLNKVFVKKRESDLMEMDDAAPPAEQWIKLWTMKDSNNAVMSQAVTYDTVISEGCGRGKKPILIFATEKAMSEAPDPLSPALKTFIKFDNRLFKQELLQSEQAGSSREKKRSAGGISNVSPSESKRLNRANSNSSMATNQASAGDLDDDMRDAPFDYDEDFTAAVQESLTMNLGGGAGQVERLEDLVDVSDPSPAVRHLQSNGGMVLDGADGDPVDLLTPGTEGGTEYSEKSETPISGRTSVKFAGVTLLEAIGGNENTNGFGASGPGSSSQVVPPPPPPQPEMQERGNNVSLFSAQAAARGGEGEGEGSMDLGMKGRED